MISFLSKHELVNLHTAELLLLLVLSTDSTLHTLRNTTLLVRTLAGPTALDMRVGPRFETGRFEALGE